MPSCVRCISCNNGLAFLTSKGYYLCGLQQHMFSVIVKIHVKPAQNTWMLWGAVVAR